jgi:hypothetical protein
MVSVVRIVMISLSIGVGLGPIVFALNQYGWNITPLITPSYSPPKVDFRMEFTGFRVIDKEPKAVLRLTNLGEIGLELVGLNATAYGPSGEAVAPVTLAHPVTSSPGSVKEVVLDISLSEGSVTRLLPYFRDRGYVDIEVKGEVFVKVFGSVVTVPLTTSFRLSREDVKALGLECP